MAELPTTRASLLVRIRDARDADAWGQFVDLYAPVVYGFARRQQLQDADAADLSQEVLRSVAGAAGRLEYDPQRGSFRAWLFTVTRNKLLDYRRMRHHGRPVGGTTAQERLEEQPAPDEQTNWDDEFRRRVFAVAAQQVEKEFEPKTWQAFWQTAVEGCKPQEVAVGLGLSVGAIYIAKSRVQARLKERVRELTNEE